MITKYIINYQGNNITKDISDNLISLTYSDILEGRASDLRIEVEDKDKRWAGSWYPKVGDAITCAMGNDGAPLLDCGTFFVDEFECVGSRNAIVSTIKALSVRSDKIYSMQRVKSYAGRDFGDVAKEIAAELGMSVTGELSGLVKQNSAKTGLAFLLEVSKKMGLIMKIEKEVIHFEKYESLKKKSPIRISYADVINFRIQDKAQGVYNSCTCKWWDAKAKQMYSGTYQLGIKGGLATIWEEVDDDDKAEDRAKNWLEDKQKKKAKITIGVMGDVRLLAGTCVELSGFGNNDGKYVVHTSEHRISRQGYFTDLDIRK